MDEMGWGREKKGFLSLVLFQDHSRKLVPSFCLCLNPGLGNFLPKGIRSQNFLLWSPLKFAVPRRATRRHAELLRALSDSLVPRRFPDAAGYSLYPNSTVRKYFHCV